MKKNKIKTTRKFADNLSKKILQQILAFVCDQWLILFFIFTTGVKLAFLYNRVLDLNWGHQGFNYGIYLGFVGSGLIFAPLYFVRKYKNRLAIILEFFISCLILIDTIYFSYFGALPTVGLISAISQTADVGPALADLIKWWFPLYFIDIFIIFIFNNFIRTSISKIKREFNITRANITTSIIALTVTVFICISSILSIGTYKLSEVYEKGYDTVSTSHHYGVLTAHAIDVIRFINQQFTRLSIDQEKELVDWVKDNKPNQSISDLNGYAKYKNVIIIQIESLGGFVINQKINDKEITPNLNKLSRESQFFPNNRFLYGGGHTSDTDFVTNTSYFPLYDAAVFVRYSQSDFTSLPKILNSKDYSTYAYHGFNRNFWNRDSALKSLGYQKFYAADNYPDGGKINMGLNDGDFLLKTADYIKEQPKPSLSFVITLSSHTPFEITNQTKSLGINPSNYPNQVGGYLENINYVDRMIGKFFDKLRVNNIYEDSLVLVYGDHTPVLPAFKAGTIEYNPKSDQEKEVPLFIKLPNINKGKTYEKQGTNLDIMPTILDLMDIKTNQLMFGQSLFTNINKSLRVCDDQFKVFKSTGDCNSNLDEEKLKSSVIIRYNQFDNVNL